MAYRNRFDARTLRHPWQDASESGTGFYMTQFRKAVQHNIGS